MYFDATIDKSTEKTLHSVKVIPGRGAWLEFDVDKRDTVGVRIDRKRRQPVTVLLKALGWTNEQIRERFGFSEIMMSTLEKDNTAGTDEALLDIYRKLRRANRRPRSRRRPCWRTCSSRTSATTWPGWAATRSTRSSG